MAGGVVSGSNAREEKVRRFLGRLPPTVDRVRAEVADGDTWETVHVITLPVEDAAIVAREACSALQDAANMAGRRIRGRIAAFAPDDPQPLVQRTQHDPDPDAIVTELGDMDGSRESMLTQCQRHLEGNWRIALQERHHMRTGFQEVLEQQGRVIEKLADLVDASHRREGEARELAGELWERVLDQQAEPDEQEESVPQLPPIEQMMGMVRLLGALGGSQGGGRRRRKRLENDDGCEEPQQAERDGDDAA